MVLLFLVTIYATLQWETFTLLSPVFQNIKEPPFNIAKEVSPIFICQIEACSHNPFEALWNPISPSSSSSSSYSRTPSAITTTTSTNTRLVHYWCRRSGLAIRSAIGSQHQSPYRLWCPQWYKLVLVWFVCWCFHWSCLFLPSSSNICILRYTKIYCSCCPLIICYAFQRIVKPPSSSVRCFSSI